MDWKQVTQEILAQLDIESVYESFGVRWAKDARASGWRPCHAFGREDKSASAEVNVGDGPARGRYRDFGDGTGQTVGLFDFAVDYAKQYRDWRDARKFFAEQAGVDMSRVEVSDKTARDGFHFYDFHAKALVHLFAKYRPGISPDAVVRSGSLSGCWNRQEIYAWPGFGPQLFTADPVGYHCLGDAGKQIWIKNRDDRHKTMQKGSPGLLNLWAIKHLEQAEVIWWTEGISDMLALQTVLRDRTDHLALTMGGISFQPNDELAALFEGKTVYIVFDADPPTHKFPAGQGTSGSVTLLQKLIKHTKEIRNVKLPQPDLTKKVDLRDYLLSGHTYEDLLTLAGKFSPIDAFDVSRELEQLRKKDTITNYVAVPSDGGNISVQPISATDIIKTMKAMTDNWPRTVSGELFYVRESPEGKDKEVTWLPNQSALFGYFHKTGQIDWQSNHTQCITKAEFYQICLTDSTRVQSVETHPHFPAIEGSYYLNEFPETTNELRYLTRFLRFFNPSTDEDWDILFSCVCTMYWGGPNGARPAFLFTSRDGRGVGKTTTAQLISGLVGGPFRFAKSESIETINKRLLTTDAMTKRVCLVDNIKTNRFSWVDFESLVTSDFISGHKMYKGDAQRANILTWFLTLNGPSLSTDISQRCIICELKKPESYGDQWLEEVQDYVRENHLKIAGDVRSVFERDPNPKLQVELRWGTWAKQVLGRLHNAQKVQDVIVRRQKSYDVEAEENSEIETEIRDRLSLLGYQPDNQAIFIPSRVMHRLWNEITLTRNTPVAVTRAIKQAVGEGQLKRLQPNQTDPKRKIRGTIWRGKNTNGKAPIEYDLEERGHGTHEWKKYM